MSTLRISDAPLLPDVDGTEKIPTGGRGDYAISVDQIKDHIFQDVGKELVGLGNVDNTSDLDKPVSTAQQAALDLKADKTYVDANLDLKADKTNVYTRSETTLALSTKADLVGGVIPSNQLPSYVDDVVEYTTSTLPIVGESGKIYVTTDTNRTWRWSGNQYVEISNGGISDSTLKLQTPRKIANVDFDGTQNIDIPHNNLIDRNIENSHTAASIGTANGENQQDINDYNGVKWRSKVGGYGLNARVMLENGDIVKSTVSGNTVNPNIDMTGWVLLPNEKTITSLYFAEMFGLSGSVSDNSAAWNALQAKLKNGDVVIFANETYNFLSDFIISKNITVRGTGLAENAGTAFNFPNPTNGVVRTVRGGELDGIRITGTQTSTVFDFENMVFGTIGLWDKYDDTAKAGYVNTRNVHISGFDTGRVNATGGSEIWNGAYRETYDTFIKGNRCGAVFLNGATHDKYHGGTISNNSAIGIWAEAPRVQYNNISFIGTTIEGNGTVDSGAGYANINYRNNVSIFAGANTVINLIGAYCERMMTYAKDGGVINKIGNYEHYNSLNFANDGSINIIGSSVGVESKMVVIPKARTLWSVMVRGSFAPLDNPDGIVARSVISSTDGYAMRSKPIYVKGNVKNKDIKRIRVSYSYKFKSGFTANTDLYMLPQMQLYSATAGRVDVVPTAQFPLDMVKGRANGQEHSFDYYYEPRKGSTTLDENGIFNYIMLNFTFHNGSTGTYPNFSSDNLEVEIYDVNISLYSDAPNNFVYDLKSGDTASRPLLNATDKGYRYYDTTLNKVMEWFGTVWIEGATSDSLVATTSTSASLTSLGNPINTANKYRGKLVLNTSNNKFYNALGSLPADVWIATDGSASLTPV